LKTFHIAIDVTSKTYEGATAYVEAETLESAGKLMKNLVGMING
jgi:hypothetical protein